LDESTLPGDLWEETESVRMDHLEEAGQKAEMRNIPGAQSAGETGIIPLKDLERREIEKALEICGTTTEGKKEAAARLGIGVATLYRKLEQYSQNDKNQFSN